MTQWSTVTPYTLRPIDTEAKPVVERLLIQSWGDLRVYAIALDTMIDASALPGWLADDDSGESIGLLTYQLTGGVLDIITLNSYRAAGGIGAALVNRLAEEAPGLGARRIRVVTTNDNTQALRFYQRNGFRLTALRVGAMRGKAGVPDNGLDGIPIRDELELIRLL